MKRSIRIDAILLKEAETVGKIEKRSMATQVEYWVQLGKAAEKLNQAPKRQIQNLKNFNKRIVTNVGVNIGSAVHRNSIMKSGYAYEKSKLGAGFVDKVYANDERISGKVVNGKFVPVKN